jgi:chromosome segregation ATPase
MANKNKKSNELVSGDEDFTAELDAATFRQDHSSSKALLESGDDTFDVTDQRRDDAQTIAKLRYDIEQLRAKWMGLDAEISAREEITCRLNAELADTRDALAGKDKLIATRDRRIKSLQAEIRDHNTRHREDVASLERKLDTARSALQELPDHPADSARLPQESPDKNRLKRTEAYADLLRRKLQDVLAHLDELEKERNRLSASLKSAEERELNLRLQISDLGASQRALQEKLEGIETRHAEEIRMLRFELGEAQETVAQTEELNSQLASDLVDTRGFKQELERMLCDSDEQSRSRIEELERDLARAMDESHDLEEKLEARGDAINVLLAELARKSEHMESIEEIGDLVSSIDDGLSAQFDEPDEGPRAPRSQERVTRVLVGKIGDKLLRFPLFKDRLTIGRTSENDIQLNVPFISRRHAVVTTDGKTTRVIDWGSKNGVYVNSKRVTEHFLDNGDIVTIGNAHFRYEERRKRDS